MILFKLISFVTPSVGIFIKSDNLPTRTNDQHLIGFGKLTCPHQKCGFRVSNPNYRIGRATHSLLLNCQINLSFCLQLQQEITQKIVFTGKYDILAKNVNEL